MRTEKSQLYRLAFIIIFSLSLLSACQGKSPSPTATLPPPTEVPTAAPPTPTLEPMAIMVNGQGITVEDFTIEIKLLQTAQQKLGKSPSVEELKKITLDDMIANELLAQEAEKAGQNFDDAALQARADQLAAQMGGADKLAAWKQSMGYSDAAFLRALARNAKAAWQRDQIMASVPAAMEQVHVKQILVQNESYANQMLSQLIAGADFSALASQNDPTTGGELGWFPRGFIFQPEVEAAAFSLEPGKFSQVIHSAVGYHIIYVVEKDPNHPLGPEARSTLQKAAVAAWIKDRQAQSQIEILIP